LLQSFVADLIIGKDVKKTFARAFLHANALFSDTAVKRPLKLMTPPDYPKGLLLP